MSVTVVQAVRDIKAAIHDESGTVWDLTADLLPRVNASLVLLYQTRPDAFYLTKIITAPPTVLTTLASGNMPVLDHYVPAVVAHVAYSFLVEGRREGDLELAAASMNRWTMIVHPRRR